MEALDAPYIEIGFGAMIRKRAGWLCALFLGEMLTATAMGHFESEIERAVVLALFIPLIISSGRQLRAARRRRSSSAPWRCARSRCATGGAWRCASSRPG